MKEFPTNMFKHKQEIKSFSNEVNSSKPSTPINKDRLNTVSLEIARVSICLPSNHHECSGKYIDSFSGKYIIKCLCNCHILKIENEENNNLNENLDNVESQNSQKDLRNSNTMGIKPYSSLINEICWCGHDRSYHLNLDQCNECNCTKFFS